MIVTFLKDHYSEETAYLIEDSRCQTKVWIETSDSKQRVVSRKTRKHGGWTNPAGEYAHCAIQLLYLDEQGCVDSTGITIHTAPADIKPLLDRCEELDEMAQTRLRAVAEAARRARPYHWAALDMYASLLEKGEAAKDDLVLVIVHTKLAVVFYGSREIHTEYGNCNIHGPMGIMDVSDADKLAMMLTPICRRYITIKKPARFIVLTAKGVQLAANAQDITKGGSLSLNRELCKHTKVD